MAASSHPGFPFCGFTFTLASSHVSLQSDGAQFSVLIEDHGSGFDPADQAKHQAGIGLRSMRERVEGIGGTITIESSPQSGTRIHVNVPMEKENS